MFKRQHHPTKSPANTKKPRLSLYCLLPVALFFVYAASAQTTKSINVNVSGSSTTTAVDAGSASGSGTINPLGIAAIAVSTTQALDSNLNPMGPIQATITFAFNRLDSFSVTATIPAFTTTATFPGTISGGKGAYNGASGSGTFTITIVSAGSTNAQLTLSGIGNIKVGQTMTALSLQNVSLTSGATPVATISATGTGSMTPFGNVTMNATVTSTDLVTAQGTAVFTLNANDSLKLFFSIPNVSAKSYTVASTVIGGTGAFAGVSGSATLTLNSSMKTFTLIGSGTVTQPAQGTTQPIITSVKTSGSDAPFIAPNTWIEVQGTNLVPANTPAAGVFWSNAPDFLSGKMPILLGGISATTNAKPAYIYFFCHACVANQADQINILTSLDTTVGQMLLVVTNGTVSSAPFIVTMQAASPSFLRWDLIGHPVATHVDFSLLGPTGLFPGTTPARKMEPILVYGDGFGLPTAALVEGSSSQSGVLPNPQPSCVFGTTSVSATVVLVSPGLYGFGLTVPNTAVSGDNPLTCTYMNVSTPPGDVINVL